jgi:hypothetical protein
VRICFRSVGAMPMLVGIEWTDRNIGFDGDFCCSHGLLKPVARGRMEAIRLVRGKATDLDLDANRSREQRLNACECRIC